MAREKLGDILIKAGLLDEMGLQRALNEQQRWGGQLGRYLVELGLITEETLVRALSTQYKVPAVSLDPHRMDVKIGKYIPRDICERNGLCSFRADPKKKFLDVAMCDPSNLDAIDEVRVATKYNVRPHIAAPTVIDKAISFIFYGEMSIGNEMDLSPESNLRLDPAGSELIHMAKGEKMEVKVNLQDQTAMAAGQDPDAEPVKIPDVGEEGSAFHLTLDVPAVDKAKIKRQSAEEQLDRLEATVTRNTAILRTLLETMARKGLFTRQEIRKIIASKKQ
jgi:hypothetical protein